jgi:hypothetical protein
MNPGPCRARTPCAELAAKQARRGPGTRSPARATPPVPPHPAWRGPGTTTATLAAQRPPASLPGHPGGLAAGTPRQGHRRTPARSGQAGPRLLRAACRQPPPTDHDPEGGPAR